METRYFVVDAPGCYGDKTRVMSSHRTLAAALRAARKYEGLACVREGSARRGEVWLRVYEEHYRMVRS